jgi:hypothetical protein
VTSVSPNRWDASTQRPRELVHTLGSFLVANSRRPVRSWPGRYPSAPPLDPAAVPFPNVGLRDVRFGGAAGFRARIFYPTDATTGTPAPYLSDGKATSAGASPKKGSPASVRWLHSVCTSERAG